jgi:hypothetical protein
VPDAIREKATDTGTYSNIEPEDYVGADKCADCHRQKYESWSRHPHRWMNAAATLDHVKGDFSDQASLPYLGGTGRFWREGDQFRMAAERGSVRREFRITRTIGSRYFEYYIGVQSSGPESADDPRYRVDHVLPFGYWLSRQQWVPTVHIGIDREEDADDPRLNPYEDFYFTDYDRRCSICHTTLPMGDWLLRNLEEAGVYTPYPFTLQLDGYLKRQRRSPLAEQPNWASNRDIDRLLGDLVENR